MSHTPKLTTIGLYNFNDDLFGALTLPEEYDKDIFIETFLTEHGERGALYLSYDYMRYAIGAWGRKWFGSLQKIAAAMSAEYNPLHNYDRSENYTDTENIDTAYANGTENKVSAYNSSTYQPDRKTDIDGSNDVDRTLQHTASIKGNIGVTTSQQMLNAEIDLRSRNNMYSIAAQMLADEICLKIY